MRYDIFHATIDSEACGLATQLFYVRPRYVLQCTAAHAVTSAVLTNSAVFWMQFGLLEYQQYLMGEMARALHMHCQRAD